MRHRRSYSGSAGLLPSVLELLSACFPGFGETEGLARAHGLKWEEVSTPFVRFEGGKPVSHVGVLGLTLVVDGRERQVGGVHAVCTHPEFRRRGLYRSLIEEALVFCDERCETQILSTAAPAIYEPFGFRHFPEHRFVGEGSRLAGRGGLRELDRSDPADLAALHGLLADREAVSSVLGAVRERDVFLFDTARATLMYSEALDTVVAARREGTTLTLLDIVARKMPTLAELLDLIADPIDRVEVCFSADRLGGDLTPEPHLLDGDDYLMVRGPFLPEGTPAMLSPVSRC